MLSATVAQLAWLLLGPLDVPQEDLTVLGLMDVPSVDCGFFAPRSSPTVSHKTLSLFCRRWYLKDHNLGSEGADQSRLSIKSQTKVVLIDTLTTHADAKYYRFLLRFTNLNSPFPFSKAESPGLGDSESCPLSLHQSMKRTRCQHGYQKRHSTFQGLCLGFCYSFSLALQHVIK